MTCLFLLGCSREAEGGRTFIMVSSKRVYVVGACILSIFVSVFLGVVLGFGGVQDGQQKTFVLMGMARNLFDPRCVCYSFLLIVFLLFCSRAGWSVSPELPRHRLTRVSIET